MQEAKERLTEAKNNNADAETLKELQTEVWGLEYMLEEWHGENVFPLEWTMAKIQIKEEER